MNKQSKKANQSPQEKLLNKLRVEQQQVQNSWRTTNAQLNETREKLEKLQKKLAVLEGQSSAIQRNIKSLISSFDIKQAQMPEGKKVKKVESSKKKKGDK